MIRPKPVTMALAVTAAVLTTACRNAAAQSHSAWRTLRLTAFVVAEPEHLPAEACARLFVEPGVVPPTPTVAALATHVANRVRRGKGNSIEVDRDGLGEQWFVVDAGKPQVIAWFSGGRTCDLLFFFRGRDWWVASASGFLAKSNDVQIRLLDADADGLWWDANDLLQCNGGGWRAIAGIDRVDDGTFRARLRLAPQGKQMVLQYLPTDRPDGLDDNQWLTERTVNALRNEHGLAPVLDWPEANDGLLAHTRFLQLNAPEKRGTLTTYYGEAEGIPGRTDPGDKMSRSGCVVYLSTGQTPADHVRQVLRMTQSREDVFAPGAARFGSGCTQGWSFLRAEAGPVSGGSHCVLLPGAGAHDVPREGGNNWPFPRSFPDLYNSPRGIPISVRILTENVAANVRLRARSIALFTLPDLREVPGFVFSIRDIDPNAAEDRFFFVPGEPLAADRDFLAQAAMEAVRSNGDSAGMTSDAELLQWQFHTGK